MDERNKKKVGIVTLYHNTMNYGGLLQAYSLQKVLTELGYDAEILDIENVPFNGKMGHMSYVGPRRAFEVLWRKSFYWLLIKMNKTLSAEIEHRTKYFRSFAASIPHSKMYKHDDLQAFEDVYDSYITGSDQVWNPGYWNNALLLNFVRNKRKISYAASLGVTSYSADEKQILKKALADYYSISVRECGGRKVLKEITNKPVEVVLDPTLLVDAEYWRSIAEPVELEGPYAFLFTVKDGAEHRKAVYNYCRSAGVKLVTIPYTQLHFRFSDVQYSDVQLSEIGPRQWIWLIDNAQYVFTDSFHGTAFSINLRKNFWSFEDERDDNGDVGTQRIGSLLSQLGLIDRRVSFTNLPCREQLDVPVDYSNVTDKMDALIKQSVHFLKDNI